MEKESRQYTGQSKVKHGAACVGQVLRVYTSYTVPLAYRESGGAVLVGATLH
jgi:hypothetical protein